MSTQLTSRSTLLPYTTLFRSAQAVQEKSSVPVVDIGGMAARIQLKEGPATITADKARYNMDTQKVDVDRKSTRLNSSHSQTSYAVFCLKKKMTSSVTSTISRS